MQQYSKDSNPGLLTPGTLPLTHIQHKTDPPQSQGMSSSKTKKGHIIGVPFYCKNYNSQYFFSKYYVSGAVLNPFYRLAHGSPHSNSEISIVIIPVSLTWKLGYSENWYLAQGAQPGCKHQQSDVKVQALQDLTIQRNLICLPYTYWKAPTFPLPPYQRYHFS